MPNAADAIILCGGAGLRLKGITGSAPKSLACIGDRPFLEILFLQLKRQGFDEIILAVGHQSDQIRTYFGDRALGLKIRYSVESTPLGTGGALRAALGLMHSATALIMNGDSYTDADLRLFLKQHVAARADLTAVVVPTDGRVDIGLVSVDSGNGRVLGFKEKQSVLGPQYVNAGIYLANKNILSEIPAGMQISLESEMFPRWLSESKNIWAFHHMGSCVDIGTPERYQNAQITLARVEGGAPVSLRDHHEV